MPDNKISSLDVMTTYGPNDLMVVVDVGTTNVTKQGSLKDFSQKALCNTSINGTLRTTGNSVFQGAKSLFQAELYCNADATFHTSVVVANNTIQITDSLTPNSSNSVIGGVGTICWDDDYVYVQTANNVVKRATLSTW